MRWISVATSRLLLVTILLNGCASAVQVGGTRAFAPDLQAIAEIRTVFVGDFGNIESADLVREKFRMRLLQSNRFGLVEKEELADAIVTGSAGVSRRISEGETELSGVGLLRMIDRKSQRTIWAYEYHRSYSGSLSITTRVADQMADNLMKVAVPAK